MKTKTALSYFGSDSEVAEDLASMVNGRRHCTIMFVGGASVIPFLEASHVVCHDLNADVINFYNVLNGYYGPPNTTRLIKRCKDTLSHPVTLAEAKEVFSNDQLLDPVARAYAYWCLCWLGRAGQGGTDLSNQKMSVRWTPSGGSNASRITSAADDLIAWSKHFKRCEFTCLDYEAAFKKLKDSNECAMYADPPWIGAGDQYTHRFKREDHLRFHTLATSFTKTQILIRYGDDPFIRSLYQGWTITEANSRTQSNIRTPELWITNF